VLGRITGNPKKGEDLGDGRCRLGTSATGGLPDSTIAVHVTGWNDWLHVPVMAVTSLVSPGSVTFRLECMSFDAPLAMRYLDAAITAVALSES
jgi:hypothetical protein